MAEQFSAGKQIAIGLLGMTLAIGAGMKGLCEKQTSNDPAYQAVRLEEKMRTERKELEECENSMRESNSQYTQNYTRIQKRLEADIIEYNRLTANPKVAAKVGRVKFINGISPLFYVGTLLVSTSLFANGIKRKGIC
jgi:hypothetical protein